jgi:hypothetical protein
MEMTGLFHKLGQELCKLRPDTGQSNKILFESGAIFFVIYVLWAHILTPAADP